MSRLHTLGALGLSALLAACSATAPEPVRPARPAVDASRLVYPDLGDIPEADLERVELSNGVVVYVSEDHSLPLVELRAVVQASDKLDPADHVGLSSIAATAMRSGGTQSLDPDALNLAVENVGASLEAFGAGDQVVVRAQALTETAPQVLGLFADVLVRPRFDADQVDLAVRRAKSGVARRNDNPGGIANRELFKAIYGADSPYARTTEYWTLDAISPDDLERWHARSVVPANTRILVVGDVDPAEITAQLEAAFAGWTTPAGYAAPELPSADAERGARLLFVPKDDVEQSTILIGHAGSVRRDHPDYPALVVMNEVLGGGFSGRMLRTIRTDLGLAYSAGGVYTAGYTEPGVFYSSTSTKTESTVQAVRAMREVIASMQTEPPTEAELALAKEAYLNSFVFNFDTAAEVAARQLTYEAYGYPDDYLQRVKDGVEAVTAEDVQRVARDYLHPDEAVTLVLGKADEFDAPLTTLGAVDTLDVAIPTVPPGGAAVAGSPAIGRALLDAAADSLGGRAAFAAVAGLRTVAVTTAPTPQGDVEVTSTTTIVLPDTLHSVQATPLGTVTILSEGGSAQILTAGGPQPAPAGIDAQIRSQLYLSIGYLMSRAADLAVESVPGQERTVKILAPGVATPYTLTIGEDGRPSEIVSVQATQAGPAEVRVRIEDYRPVGDLVLPFRYVQTSDGAPSGTTVVQSIRVDPAIPDGMFAR